MIVLKIKVIYNKENFSKENYMLENPIKIEKIQECETYNIWKTDSNGERVEHPRLVLDTILCSEDEIFRVLMKRVLVKKVQGNYILEENGFLFYFEGFSEEYSNFIEKFNLSAEIQINDIHLVQRKNLNHYSLNSQEYPFGMKKQYNEFELTDDIKEIISDSEEYTEDEVLQGFERLKDIHNAMNKDLKINKKENKYYIEKDIEQIDIEELSNKDKDGSILAYSKSNRLTTLNIASESFLAKLNTTSEKVLQQLVTYMQLNNLYVKFDSLTARLLGVYQEEKLMNKTVYYPINYYDFKNIKTFSELEDYINTEKQKNKINEF